MKSCAPLFTTLHHSSPLFTTLHHSSPLFTRKICENLWIENRRPKGKPNLWDIKCGFGPRPNRSIIRLKSVRNPWSQNVLLTQRYPMNKISRWRVGEGWWRVSATLHLSHPQCLSGFQPIWWRVKSKKKSGAFIKKAPDVSFCAWQWQIIALVKGNVVP